MHPWQIENKNEPFARLYGLQALREALVDGTAYTHVPFAQVTSRSLSHFPESGARRGLSAPFYSMTGPGSHRVGGRAEI